MTANGKRFSERDVAGLSQQILYAISYIHENGLVHRDLKLENIMVEVTRNADRTTDLVCKLTDFGFACVIQPGTNLQLKCGSPLYMSPEIVMNESYGQGVDIWSFGVAIYALLCGKFPFDGRKVNVIYDKIKDKHEVPDYSPL